MRVTFPRLPALNSRAGKLALALIVLNEIRGLMVASAIVAAWLKTNHGG